MFDRMQVGKRIRLTNNRNDKKGPPFVEPAVVHCQGCGKVIDPDGDISNVEYVKTKRGSEWFFHTECADRVWKRGIVL